MTKETKIFLLIIGCVVLTYANTLTHGFVGDDSLLFLNNNFYRQGQNVFKILSPEFITSIEDFQEQVSLSGSLNISGCASYRPVPALSFFMDFFLWKFNPFGFHLTNILLHCLAAFLVYRTALHLIKNENAAVLSALLFALHPAQAEVVNIVGYRSDLISTSFYLTAFLAYAGGRRAWIIHGSFFLALFSKETAVTFPFILFFYHVLLKKESVSQVMKDKGIFFLIQLFILLFYLFIYFFVFPNSSLVDLKDVNFSNQVIIIGRVLYEYALVLIIPFKVKVLPSFTVPSFDSVNRLEAVVLIALIFVSVLVYKKCVQQKRAGAFLLIWLFFTYLPTANILSLPNPIAYRFLYLPSVGFHILWALILTGVLEKFNITAKERFVQFLVKVVLAGLCMAVTIPLNEYYKSSISLLHKGVEDFPQSTYPYLVLGSTYRSNGKYEEAVVFFKKYLENKKISLMPSSVEKPDHEIYVQIGTCYVNDHDTAIKYFKKAISLEPENATAYAHIGKAYLLKGDPRGSLKFINQAIALQEDLLPGYVYGLEAYMALGDRNSTNNMLKRALKIFPDEEIFLNIKKQLSP